MKAARSSVLNLGTVLLTLMLTLAGCGQGQESQRVSTETATSAEAGVSAHAALTDEQLLNLVRASYSFVAMYNVINKAAMDAENPTNTGGWNRIKANTTLADHT